MRYNEQLLTDHQGNPVLKLFHSAVAPGKRHYREHHHTECELSVFLSGSGTYTLPQREYSFAKNDIFLFNSEEQHCITDISDTEELNLLNIHFEPRILWSDSTFPEASGLLRIFFDRSDSFENRIDRNNIYTKQIVSSILELEEELVNKQFNYQMIVRMKLYSILTMLIRHYGYVKPEAPHSRHEENFSRMSSVLRFIDSNLDKELSLRSLAEKAAMNKSYFSTVFKQLNGLSPWEYISIKRVEKAIYLLKNTNMTKLEIAGQCGFNSPSNFYRIFRNVTGKTPKDYQCD